MSPSPNSRSVKRLFFSVLWSLALLIAALVPVRSAVAQTYLSEDFESGIPSQNFVQDGVGVNWQVNTSYAYAGSRSAYFQTSAAAGLPNTMLTSRSMNLSSATRPLLTFYHIAALERLYDQGYVEASSDGGLTWTVLSNTQYNGNSWRKTGSNIGSSTMTYPDGPYFDQQSRPEWDMKFTSTGSLPVVGQSLWYKEVFDLSAFKSANVKVRFRVKSNTSNDYYGWLIDNVAVVEAPTTRIAGTRVIGTGGFPSFRAAAQALADSGVGAGGVTFLVQPGTYNDSLYLGNWSGVSAANRVRFKSNGGTVTIQRYGSSNSISLPSTSTGYSYSYYYEPVVLMSGSQYTTFDGITFGQTNINGGAYYTDVGVYMTNGCRFDSVVRCVVNLSTKYYYSCGLMVISNQYTCAPGLNNVANKFIDDTVNAYHGVWFSSQFATIYDSLNEFSGTAPGKAWINAGPQPSPLSYTTTYGMCLYGQANCSVNNMLMNVSTNSMSTYTVYGVYCTNLTNPVFTNNTLSNLGYSTSPTTYYNYIYGLYMSSNIYRPIVTGNTMTDWYGYYLYGGIYCSSSYEPLIQGNTFQRFSFQYWSGAPIYTTSCTRPRIIGNKIRDMRLGSNGGTSSTTAYGIYASNTGPTVIYNNMISDFSCNYPTTGYTIYGIYYSASTAARDSICNNSVYFRDQTGSGGTALTSTSHGLYISSQPTTFGGELHVYNNLIVNRQTNGTGSLAYGITRIPTTGTFYCDNNDIYSATDATDTTIHKFGQYPSGTPRGLITQWRAGIPNIDLHSFSEMPTFTTDSLHISTSVATRLESAGKSLASVKTDIDGDTRNAAPDIGADEGSFTASSTDDVGPAITYSRIPKSNSTSGVTISATITDPSGVATGANTQPRLYYRSTSTGTWSLTTGTQSGSTWSFTTAPYSAGTQLVWYIAAQDNVATPNVSTYPNGGSGATPPGSTAPTVLDSTFITSPYSGDYLVGGVGGYFPSLKAAIDSISLNGISGPVRLLLNANTFSEGALSIYGPIAGSSATNTITIKPNTGFSPVITTSGTSNYFLLINGASNIIVDGSNTANGTTRDLTLNGGATYATFQVWIQTSVGADGTAQPVFNVTVKNCNLKPTVTSPLTNTNYRGFQIQMAGPGAKMNGITVTNNFVGNVYYGIVLSGESPVNPIRNVTISGNNVGTVADSLYAYGLNIANTDSLTIDNNDIQHLAQGSGTTTEVGILLSSGVTNAVVTRNKIHNMVLTSTAGQIYGIQQSSSFPPNTNTFMANNAVYDLHARATTSGTSATSPAIAGIAVLTGGNDIIASNTIHLTDSTSTSTSTSVQYTAGLILSSSAFSETVLNNVISNWAIVGPTYGRNVALVNYYGAGTIARANNNIYYAPGNRGSLAYSGIMSRFVTTLDSVRLWNGNVDQQSYSQAVPFVSTTDPHVMTTVPTRVESGGSPVAGVTVDLDGDTRNASTPDIGADEGNFTPYGAIDINLATVYAPVTGTKFVAGTGVRPLIRVRNDGIATATNLPIVDWLIDSTTMTVSTVTTTIDSLRPNEARYITLDSVTYPTTHTYGQRIYANAATDINRANDSSAVMRILTAPGLNGVYNVGSGQWATTIKAAFDSLVNNGISGNVTFRLTDANYDQPAFTTGYIGGGTGLILGANAGRRLRIKPAPGVSPVVNLYGSTSTSMSTYYGTVYPGLGLQNTQYLTIDGSNTEGGTTRDLTMRMHPNTVTSAANVLGLSASGFDSVKNCVIWDSTYYSGMSSSGFSSWGIFLSAPSSNAVGSNNNVFANNWIRDCYYGIYNYGVSGALSRNNTFIGNKISRFTYCAIYTYYYNTNTSYLNNTIQSDTTAAVSLLYGSMHYGQYGTMNFVGNRIQKLRAYYTGGTIYGIYDYYGGGYYANNLVAIDHDTSSNMSPYPLYINYSGYSTYPTSNFYNNTIYCGGTSTYGGSYFIYRYYSGGDMVNNVFVLNRSTAPSYFIYNYNYPNVPDNWNNNVYFKGNSASPTWYNYNGTTSTSSTTLAQWQSNNGFDAKSYFDNQVWADSVGANFAPASGVATRIESHATPILGLTTDINGNTRDARYPDIGAFEGNFTPKFDVNMTAVSIDQPTNNTHYFTGQSIAAAATFRQSGITTVTNVPVTLQAIDGGGVVRFTQTSSIASLSQNQTTQITGFNFIPTTPGLWKIIAIAQHPAEEWTIDDTASIQVNVTAGMSGTYAVGVGQFAPTIKAAFDSLTNRGIVGPVTFSLTDASYSEPPITQNLPWNLNTWSVTVRPASGVSPTVTFNPTVLRPWGLRLNSVPNVTFDGANTVGGTTRNTTLQFAGGNNANGQAVIWLADSLGGNGSNSATLKNLRIFGGGTASNMYDVYAGGTTLGSTSGQANTLTVQNSELRNAGYGVYANGLFSAPNTGLTVTQNQFGPLVGDNANRIGVEGVTLMNATSPQITRNEITGLYSSTGSVAGIDLASNVSDAVIQKNKIHDIEAYGGAGRAAGIVDNSGNASTMSNNMIWHVTSVSTNTTAAGVNAGIYLGTASGTQLFFNSVSLTGNRDTVGFGLTVGKSAGLYVASTATGLTSRNNIFASSQTENARGVKSYGYVLESATSLTTASNNDISGSGTQSTNARIGVNDYTRMQDIRTALGGTNEAASFAGVPPFTSDADLHINPLTPSLVESGAVPVAGITDDIDGNVRNVTTPDVGANEGNFAKAVDVIAQSIDNPANFSVYRPFAKTTAPVVTFRNGAAGTGTNIPVTLVTIDSLVNTKRFSTRTIPTLGPNAAVQVTFDSLILPDIGSYGLYAYSSFALDVDNTNDTIGPVTVKVCAPMAGTYYVGQGRDFPTLGIAANTLRDCGVQAQVKLVLTDNAYNETTPISFVGITGLNAANTVTIKPQSGISPVTTIATSTTLPYGVIMDSVNWIVLDGSNQIGGTSRDWTIRLTGSNTTASAILVRDGSNDSLKNLVVRNVSMAGGNGIALQPTRVKMSGDIVINNDIGNAQNGVNIMTATLSDTLGGIWNNTITRFAQFGVLVGDNVKSLMIRGNTVRSDTMATTALLTGINVTGANTSNVEIGANKVMDFATSATNPVLTGVALANTGATATRALDNMIGLGRQLNMATASITGVQLAQGASALLQNNTVALGGTGISSGSSYALWVDAPVNVTMYNNIFANTRSNVAGGTGSHYGFYSNRPPTGVLTSDYNDWYVSGNGGMLGQALATNITTLPMWRMFTGGSAWGMLDRNSFSEAPNFLGTSDLHVATTPSRIQNGGKPGLFAPNGGLDYDIDGNARGFISDVGATEFTGPRNARLKGSYTIGGTTGAFPSLAAAIAALNTNGVDGAVDFYLAKGTETVTAPLTIIGADGLGAQSIVTFHAAQNGTSTVIGQGGLNPLRVVIVLDSAANNIVIDGDNGTNNGVRSLTISNATTGVANSALVITNGASSITIRNTQLTTTAANNGIRPTTDGLGVVAIAGGLYGGPLSRIVVQNDSIWNGWNGVYAGSASGNWGMNTVTVRKSNISDFGSSGIYFGNSTTQMAADGNYITTVASPGSDSTVRGIRLSTDNAAVGNVANNNWIINVRSTGTSNVTGIEMVGGTKPFLYNNFISLSDNTTGSLRGIDEASVATTGAPTNARIYFNSINMYGDKNVLSPSDYGIAINANDGVGNGDSVIDNIVKVTRVTSSSNPTYAFGLNLTADVDAMNYNDYFAPTGNVGQIGSVMFTTLSSLRAIPSWGTRDANSISGDPKFVSNKDLHLGDYTSAVFNKGTYLTAVTTDIDYQGRDLAPKTEIGADENGLNSILPVELMSLAAQGLDSKVMIDFSTANEKDVYGFAVLRSEVSDQNFEEIASAMNTKSLIAHGSEGHSNDYSLVDRNVTNGTTYYYKVVSIDNDGTRKEYARVAMATPGAPNAYAITGNYPNPLGLGVAGQTTIAYTVAAPAEKLVIAITDLTGRTVRTLVSGSADKAGAFSTTWDAKDDDGTLVPSGTYFVSLRATTADGQIVTSTAKIAVTK